MGAPSAPHVPKPCAPSSFHAPKPCSSAFHAPLIKRTKARPILLHPFSKPNKAKPVSNSLQPSKPQLYNGTKPCSSPFNSGATFKVRQSAPFGGASKPLQLSNRPGPLKFKPLFKPLKSVPPKLSPLLMKSSKPVHSSFTKPTNALSSNPMPPSKSAKPPQFSKSPIIKPIFGRSRAKPIFEKAKKKPSVAESTPNLVFRTSPPGPSKKTESKSVLPTGQSFSKLSNSSKLEKPVIPSNMRFGKSQSCEPQPAQQSFFSSKEKNGYDTSSKVKHDTLELEDQEEEPCCMFFDDDEDLGLGDFI